MIRTTKRIRGDPIRKYKFTPADETRVVDAFRNSMFFTKRRRDNVLTGRRKELFTHREQNERV